MAILMRGRQNEMSVESCNLICTLLKSLILDECVISYRCKSTLFLLMLKYSESVCRKKYNVSHYYSIWNITEGILYFFYFLIVVY